MYDVHRRFIGMRVVDFLLVLIELFYLVIHLRRYERQAVRTTAINKSAGVAYANELAYLRCIDDFE